MGNNKRKTVPAALSYEQVLEILNEVDFEEAILVGGQAVLMYASVFHLGNKIELGISGDVDLIGKATAAQALAARLKDSKITLASFDSNTINTAVIAIDLNEDEFVQIDFLSHISGVDSSRLEKRVQEIEVQFSEESDENKPLVIKIINPLDLLTSKLHNYVTIESKRDAQGLAQARLAIEIAHRYLQDLAHSDQDSFDRALKVFCDQCLTPPYIEADVRYGLKAFSMLSEIDGFNPLFLEKDFPNRQRSYDKKVTLYKGLMERQEALAARNKKA